MRRGTGVLAVFIVALTCAWGEDAGFSPLITDNTLKHFMGDKERWSFRDGVLSARFGGDALQSEPLFSAERFANFILKFSARSAGGKAGVLFRATIQPPKQVVGYQAEIGGSNWGGLSFKKPGRFNLTAMKAEPGEESPLVRSGSKLEGTGWNQYEIAAEGDRLRVTVNGKTTADYRGSGVAFEGMIGFQLEPRNGSEIEFKNLEIKMLGDVRRKSSDAWARETNELLALSESTSGFQPLFDRQTLNGWRDNTQFWSTKDGLIVGQSHNSFVVTEKEYADFILKASVRLSPNNGNSGIQVRSQVIPHGMKGYQVDIGDPWWGHLYQESTERGILIPVGDRSKRLKLVRAGDWNDFVIICRDDHIIAKLNGEVTADLVDYFGEKTGRIGLQVHVGPPMKVEFRDVQIKELR